MVGLAGSMPGKDQAVNDHDNRATNSSTKEEIGPIQNGTSCERWYSSHISNLI
jgi:hypothetical protein